MAENYIWFSAILIIFWLMERKTMDAYEVGVKVENLVWEIKDNLRTQIEKELKEELKTKGGADDRDYSSHAKKE